MVFQPTEVAKKLQEILDAAIAEPDLPTSLKILIEGVQDEIYELSHAK